LKRGTDMTGAALRFFDKGTRMGCPCHFPLYFAALCVVPLWAHPRVELALWKKSLNWAMALADDK